VSLGSTSGASGRLGLRAKWRIADDAGEVWEPYLRANLWDDWAGQATTVYSGVDQVPLLDRGQRLELGGGVTAKLNASISFYANADYQFAVGDTPGGERNGVRGAAGLRYTW
jgi:outer membrane autotransporter protein